MKVDRRKKPRKRSLRMVEPPQARQAIGRIIRRKSFCGDRGRGRELIWPAGKTTMAGQWETHGSDKRKREDLLHRNAELGHGRLGSLLQESVRLEHPDTRRWKRGVRRRGGRREGVVGCCGGGGKGGGHVLLLWAAADERGVAAGAHHGG